MSPLSRPPSVSEAPCRLDSRSHYLSLALCLAINLAIFVGVARNRPLYLRNTELMENPDARHYVLLGKNVLLHGRFSRAEEPPLIPDMLRTPLYPLVAGALDLLAGPAAIFIA